MNAFIDWLFSADGTNTVSASGIFSHDNMAIGLLANAILAITSFICAIYIVLLVLRQPRVILRGIVYSGLSLCLIRGICRTVAMTIYWLPTLRLATLLNLLTAINGLVFTISLLVMWQPINTYVGLLFSAKDHLDELHDLESQLKVMALAEQESHHFRLLAESIPDIVFTANPGGDIDFYNQKWYDYTGVDRLSKDTLGWSWRDLVHELDLQPVLDTWTNAISVGQHCEIRFRLLRYDKEYRYHLSRIAPLKDPAGNVIKWYGTCTDIDDQLRDSLGDRYPALGELRKLVGH